MSNTVDTASEDAAAARTARGRVADQVNKDRFRALRGHVPTFPEGGKKGLKRAARQPKAN